MDSIKKELLGLLLGVRHAEASLFLSENMKDLNILHVINKTIVPVLDEIGRGWENGTVALSQVYLTGKFIEEWVSKQLPDDSPDLKTSPVMAIAVLDDFHFLGKRIVYSIIRSAGYKLIDYGRQTPENLVELLKKDEIELVFISTLMLPSALKVAQLRKLIDSKKLSTKIIVGGAPFRFDENLWEEVKADAMCYNANDAISIIKKIGGEL